MTLPDDEELRAARLLARADGLEDEADEAEAEGRTCNAADMRLEAASLRKLAALTGARS